ncbi:MAG TPA: hypothetical protein VFL70_02110 [Bacteroidia bacterium]|nr:hypothetical protein [Bacteroidia bacterium]
MKTPVLNLVLLDDNTLIATPIKNYLNKKFGAKINVSTFFNVDRCLKAIDKNSHVIILDYLKDNKSDDQQSGTKNLDKIKKSKPNIEITLITSNKDITRASEEIKHKVYEYIIRKGRYLYDMPQLVKKTVITPVTNLVTFPIKQIAHYYSIQDYLMMFLIVFISIGVLVVIGFLSVMFIY